MGFPKNDPHGDPIPDEDGNFPPTRSQPLNAASTNDLHTVVSVGDQSVSFLQMLNKLKIQIGSKIKIVERHDFDGSIQVKINNVNFLNISEQVAKNLIVK